MTPGSGTKRTAVLVASALAWAAVVTLRIATTEISAKPLLIVLALAPGAALFAYVIARPTTRNIAWRAAGAVVGLALLFHASWAVSSGECDGDGLCPTMIFNGAIGDVATFGIGWAVGQRADNRGRQG